MLKINIFLNKHMNRQVKHKPRIAITLGDPAGIGPEIICRLFASRRPGRYGHFLVIGDKTVLDRTARSLHLPVRAVRVAGPGSGSGDGRSIPVLDRYPLARGRLRTGTVSALGGRAAFAYVKKGIELARSGQVEALVTAPLSKAALHKAGYAYDGHTEILSRMCKAKNSAMLLAGDNLRVILVTTHCALATVPRRLSAARVFRTIVLARQGLQELGVARARIGVLALNPHAGEQGIFGQEERRHIIPAIRKARAAGLDVTGPLVPDVAFRADQRRHYDILVCMYHDQGLIPFKLLEFKTGVNITVGLPIIRTSVDHGTAFDIAGQGRADCASLERACRLAARMARLKAGQVLPWNRSALRPSAGRPRGLERAAGKTS